MRLNRSLIKQKNIIIGVSIFVIYLILSNKYNKYEIEEKVQGPPEKVFHYVSDFGNMKMLNPTILDFTITADKGNPKHWQYSVEYTEKLSHFPYLKNKIQAEINALRKSDDVFEINSTHKTCFLLGLYCLNSYGSFEFISYGEQETAVKEIVYYQCPMFLGSFCLNEVVFQRKAIVANLKKAFS